MNHATAEKYKFETGVYRPPSEGGSASLLIRVTRNCPWNKCEFCSMYKSETFSLRSVAEVKQDIDVIAGICNEMMAISREKGHGERLHHEAIIEMIGKDPSLNHHHGFVMIVNWLRSGGKTAFLQDANSPMMKSKHLIEILEYLRLTFPTINRVTSYARSKTLARKRSDELKAIHAAGLDRLHVGLETGDPVLLERIKKGSTPEDHITGGRKALAAGFQLSEYWMPGLGGKAMWEDHARNTAHVLNEINPHYIRSRPFFPLPGSPMAEQYERGEMEMLSPAEQLMEIELMIQTLDVSSKVCFDHAGNYWRTAKGGLLFSHSYEGYQFPDEKPALLENVAQGITDQKANPSFTGIRHFL